MRIRSRHVVSGTGLAALLGSEPDIEVVGVASDGDEAVRASAQAVLDRLAKPHPRE